MSMTIPSSWTFKTDEVAQGFDEHVREQLPWYDSLTQLVAMIARHYLPTGAVAYDIGASTGNMGRALEDVITARGIEWVGIDDSEAMAPLYRAPGRLDVADAVGYDYKEYDLAVCFLSLMFFPAHKRRAWLVDLLAKAKQGGAVIIVDKQQPKGGILSTALHRSVMSSKLASGANADNVLKKELSLCGIQRPLPCDFFEGLNALEFFRFGDFAGWVIEKQEHRQGLNLRGLGGAI